MLKLSVLCEARIDEAFEQKGEKHSDLCSMCEEKGSTTWMFPVEIGYRGSVGKSTIRAPGDIGLTGKERDKAMEEAVDATDNAST